MQSQGQSLRGQAKKKKKKTIRTLKNWAEISQAHFREDDAAKVYTSYKK